MKKPPHTQRPVTRAPHTSKHPCQEGRVAILTAKPFLQILADVHLIHLHPQNFLLALINTVLNTSQCHSKCFLQHFLLFILVSLIPHSSHLTVYFMPAHPDILFSRLSARMYVHLEPNQSSLASQPFSRSHLHEGNSYDNARTDSCSALISLPKPTTVRFSYPFLNP